MSNLQTFVLLLAAVSLTAITALGQHRYYARTVRRLAAAHRGSDHVLVSGRGKSRLRGAIVVLVLHKDDERIRAAAVMEGSTVLARFKDRPDWVGLPARGPLPGSSTRAAAAVADACTRLPGRRSPLPRSRFAPAPRGGRPMQARQSTTGR